MMSVSRVTDNNYTLRTCYNLRFLSYEPNGLYERADVRAMRNSCEGRIIATNHRLSEQLLSSTWQIAETKSTSNNAKKTAANDE